MAPGVCVTSLRMFMRRTDLGHLSRGLRLTPVATLTVNSWNLRGRGYCTDKYDTHLEDVNSGKINSKKASQPRQGEQKITTCSENDKSAQHSHKVQILNETNLKDPNNELNQLTVAQLKIQLREHGLSISGKKQVLIERLKIQLLQKARQSRTQSSDLHTKDPESVLLSATIPALLPTAQTDATPETECSTLVAVSDTNISQHKVDTRFEELINFALEDVHAANFKDHGDVSVEYIQGLPHLTVPLPSRNEKCRFALKPVSHKVGDLVEMLKAEDRGIDRATVLNKSGVRIASTCNIESLMDEPFWLHINDQKYKVVPPVRERIGTEDLTKLGDIRALVAQLYEALHVGEYHIQKEQELTTKLEDLKYQITPMETQKSELSTQADRRTNMMTWVGLGLMSVQFGILARLTWWEYSWDIMEPVTYFVTYGTAMAMYAYYCITKTEYNLPEVKDRQYLLTIHKRAKKKNFDVEEYNALKRQIAEIEYDLRRLRDPLNLQLPPHIDRAQQAPPTMPTLNALTSKITSGSKKAGFKLPFLEPKN